MPGIKLQKRDDDFFVSYGHGDLSRVTPLIDLLRRVCGLHIWFDGTDGNASMRSSKLLEGAIQNARGAIFCLSEAWRRSTWCENEHEVSLSEERMDKGFAIVSLRLDDVEPPGWFSRSEIIDLRQVNGNSITRLLRSLSKNTPRRFDNAEDVYLAAPWSRQSELVRETLIALTSTGWRLVGDTPNLKHQRDPRIIAIQRTTRGVVALLPHDPSQPGVATSPYILDEARLAQSLGKPLLLLAEPDVNLEADLLRDAFRGSAITLRSGRESREALTDLLEEFDEALRHVDHDDTRAFIFFAGSLREESSEEDDIATVIERSSNMRCIRGERLEGDNAQKAIIDLIKRAALVIADVSDDHRNTLIEAGIAMGAGTTLKLMCRIPPDNVLPKKRFMFEGLEVYWYRTPEERLGLCFYFARQCRRNVYVIH
jgi:hypothetical protein